MSTTEIFMKMTRWVIDNTDVRNPTEVARLSGINPVTVTKVKHGNVKSVKQETLKKINNAFGNVFNPDWMRGESDVMLMKDLAQIDSELEFPAGDAPTFSEFLAAKNETIAALRGQLADKDKVIAAQDKVIAKQDAMYNALQKAYERMSERMQMDSDGYIVGMVAEEPEKD